MARVTRMSRRAERALELLEARGAITADDLADDMGGDRYRAYVWLRGVASRGYLHQSPDSAFSLACPVPSAGEQRSAA